jgi:hypothetical protein
LKCRSIAFAVQVVGATQLNLSSGIFSEPTVDFNGISSLVVRGVPSSTFFDCSLRVGRTTGAAFRIRNSTVIVDGITFQHCTNANSDGGAISSVDSSVTVSQSRFINCSAANGGAVSATGPGIGLFLSVHGSNFTRNQAVGGAIGCPTDLPNQPCSTWGGAIASFEISNVTVVGCTMVENSVAAFAIQSTTNNAVAGGGCVSVLFRGNSSASRVYISDNSFLQCTVDVSNSMNIRVANGIVYCCTNANLAVAVFALA